VEQFVKEFHAKMCHDIENDTPFEPGCCSHFAQNTPTLALERRYFLPLFGNAGGVAVSQHVLAHAAKLYLKDADQENSHLLYRKNTKLILLLANFVKYVFTPQCYGKDASETSSTGRRFLRHQNLILSGVTGGIRFLAKHLPCDCFKKLQMSTCVGKKVAFCEGCCQDLLVEKMNTCGRCRTSNFCSRQCQTDDWPNHKKFCVQIKK
jgi:MYND finger